jgi:serine/threonine protein phosphatase PrpC/predicted Ser/Thr protein kinase
MPAALKVTVGQHSDKGRKATNQDFHGVLLPSEPLLSLKGIAVALADGISSSALSRIASESTVKSFLTDYYCTPESWSVKTSAHRVIASTNSWLHAQSRCSGHAHDKDRGYVCTLTAMVIKSAAAHIFHVGDARLYRVTGNTLEQLTNDHRVVVSSEQSYLGRALGVNAQIEIDYQTVKIEPGDVFLLATDGVYEYAGPRTVVKIIGDHADDLDRAARLIVEAAYRADSPDNLTVQIVRVEQVPHAEVGELFGQASELPLPPILEARMVFDGYRILRELHSSSRSHLYLGIDTASDGLVVLKIPSIDLRRDPEHLKRFVMEEWVARRINSAHVLKPCLLSRRRNFLYVAMEFIEGQTLRQWMVDNPKRDLRTVRGIVEQVARGLQAFHRMEMLHQDLRPDNVMIDKTGTVKIIDFGSTKVKGVIEAAASTAADPILGTAQYAAPEYFLGQSGTSRSDIFSLGVITYEMLTGRLPYGADIAKTRTRAQQRKLRYKSALDDSRDIPAWIDCVLEKATHPDPLKRYDELSEFIHELRHPDPSYLEPRPVPLIERNPLLFWQGVSVILACIVLWLLSRRYG